MGPLLKGTLCLLTTQSRANLPDLPLPVRCADPYKGTRRYGLHAAGFASEEASEVPLGYALVPRRRQSGACFGRRQLLQLHLIDARPELACGSTGHAGLRWGTLGRAVLTMVGGNLADGERHHRRVLKPAKPPPGLCLPLPGLMADLNPPPRPTPPSPAPLPSPHSLAPAGGLACDEEPPPLLVPGNAVEHLWLLPLRPLALAAGARVVCCCAQREIAQAA